jgi:hypothetical protein
MHQNTKIPSSHHPLIYLNLLNNLNLNWFMTDFHKLSNAMSPARQATHQDADSTNAFPSPPRNQRNEDHCFLRMEDLSMLISVATYLFQLAQNNFLAILAIYFF